MIISRIGIGCQEYAFHRLLSDFPRYYDNISGISVGGASYICYFAKMVSNAESIQMAAQGFMMLSFLLSVFKCVKCNMAVSCIYVFAFMNYIFCYYIPVTELPVDTLLSLQGMAMLFFINSECLNFSLDNTGGMRVLCNPILVYGSTD